MLDFVHSKISAARTLTALCRAAEAEARQDGQEEPGAEHFVLAALSLPDGGASQVLASLDVSEAQLRDAIARQYQEPLLALGVQTSTTVEPLPTAQGAGPYRVGPSGRQLVQALASGRRRPLTGARVLEAAAEQSEGVFPRALAILGLDRGHLREAAGAA